MARSPSVWSDGLRGQQAHDPGNVTGLGTPESDPGPAEVKRFQDLRLPSLPDRNGRPRGLRGRRLFLADLRWGWQMERPGGLSAIGDTPVVRLARMAGDGCAEVWVKLEAANPTGSYKDRMALAMIEAAEADGRLRPGQPVVEYTGGCTGPSLAFVCAVMCY